MLPNAAGVFVDPAKVRDYLLCPGHSVGRFKAVVFAALGYTQNDWERLYEDLLRHGRTGQARLAEAGKFGKKYLVSGTPTGPNGRTGRFISVWLLESDSAVPRFITAYPE
jgi:hypothetical protein